ncbi:MAG: hypothetical protein NVSMB42_18190 [Herpetosiphon sp.]
MLLKLIGLGFIYLAQSLAYFVALTLASPALIALLLYLYPVLVAVMAMVLFNERMTWPKAGAILLAVSGSILALGPIQGGQPRGIILGLTAAFVYAIYILVSSQITAQIGALPAATVTMTTVAALYGVLVLWNGLVLPATPIGWFAIVALGLVCTVIAVGTFLAGLARVGPTEAALLSTGEPFVTVLLTAVILHDRLSAWQAAGGVLIGTGVIILIRSQAPRHQRIHEPQTVQQT